MLENRVKCERKSNGIVNSKKNDQNINSIPSLEKYRYFLKKKYDWIYVCHSCWLLHKVGGHRDFNTNQNANR